MSNFKSALKDFVLLGIASCAAALFGGCNAPRDNRYDPDNPDKSVLGGYVREPDGMVIADAVIKLINDGETVADDTTDQLGGYLFTEIDPGVYFVGGSARHYSDVLIGPESLWAGTDLGAFDVFMTTFDFEDDGAGEMPYGFDNMGGEWRVLKDSTQPGEHTAPNVCCGSNDGPFSGLMAYRSEAEYFDLKLKFNISPTSDFIWQCGVVFRYQDEANHYYIIGDAQSVKVGLSVEGMDSVYHTASLVLQQDKWYELEVDCDTALTSFYIDGEFITNMSTINCLFSKGRVGMIVGNRYPLGRTSVNFDDISLDIE